jgi:hypothetical protein
VLPGAPTGLMEQIGDEMHPGVLLGEHPCPNLDIRESTGPARWSNPRRWPLGGPRAGIHVRAIHSLQCPRVCFCFLEPGSRSDVIVLMEVR